VTVHDPGDGILVQPAIPGALWVDHHHRAQVAGVQAAGPGGQDVPRAMVQSRVLQARSQVGAHLSRSGGGAAGPLAKQHMIGVGRYDGPVGVGRPCLAAGGGYGGPGLQGEVNGLRGGIGQTVRVVERPSEENSRRSREPFQPAAGQRVYRPPRPARVAAIACRRDRVSELRESGGELKVTSRFAVAAGPWAMCEICQLGKEKTGNKKARLHARLNSH